MILYLVAKECQDEALCCTIIFLSSIVYIIVGYEAVNDLKKMSNGNVNRASWTEEELEGILKEWRDEYDHPSVVTKSRRVKILKQTTKDIDTWDNYLKDPNFK